MNKKIDKTVLEYMEIYKTKEATEEKINLAFKTKKDISKLTGLNIERIYIIDEYAWGKSDELPAFCFLSDVRIRDIDKQFRKIEEYALKNNINILVWSMCQFEKRKNNPTEMDYYIENYGVKIYDTEKTIDIDERVKTTVYASRMELYRYYYKFSKNNPEVIMKDLLEIYALKIDYPINEKQKLEKTIEYIKHISKDKTVLDLIKKFNEGGTNKLEICKELEQYIKSLKQIRPQMTIEDVPTMKVYERLLKIKDKEGKVNISNLNKENLYAMEVIEEIMPDKIANLFNIDTKDVIAMRKKYKFKIIDSVWYSKIGVLVAKAVDINMDDAYFILKRMGIFNFERYTYDILKYISDGERYLLKEFWKLTNGTREGLELQKAKTAKDVYFRAYLCIEMLKQNGFVSEVDFLTYKITKDGKELLERLKYRDIEELNLIEIANIIGEANFYALSLIRLNNKEIMYCGNSDELEKYCDYTEETEIEENENNGNITEINFENVIVKNEPKNKVKTQTKIAKTNYNKINISKEKVGKDSEKLIYDLEREKLIKEQREDLANNVIWEAEENGDGAGYDIKSFEKRNGKYVEIYIEVKGTNKSINEPFDISRNEIEVSNKYKDKYYIYRVGNIYSENPKFYKINGKIEDNFKLEAVSFKARKK